MYISIFNDYLSIRARRLYMPLVVYYVRILDCKPMNSALRFMSPNHWATIAETWCLFYYKGLNYIIFVYLNGELGESKNSQFTRFGRGSLARVFLCAKGLFSWLKALNAES